MKMRPTNYDDENISTEPKLSRKKKNHYLYNEVNKHVGYADIDDFLKHSSGLIDDNEEKNVEVKTTVSTTKENEEEEKVFDINSVLEEAKKNRNISEEDETKKNLQNAEINILQDLNKKYIINKNADSTDKSGDTDIDSAELRGLIDTITSKSLSKDDEAIEEDDGKDLMSDLMATNTMNAIKGINLEEEMAKDILNESESLTGEEKELLNSFYTGSMELSKQDFELRDEIMEENKNHRKILILVVLIVLVIIAIVALFILKKMDII